MHLLRFETQFLTGNSCPHWGRQDQRVHRGQAGRHHRHLHHRRGGGDRGGGRWAAVIACNATFNTHLDTLS